MWMTHSREGSLAKIPTVLLANKIDDAVHRVVSKQEGLDLANRLGITMFHEVSARAGIGIDEPFLDLARVALR